MHWNMRSKRRLVWGVLLLAGIQLAGGSGNAEEGQPAETFSIDGLFTSRRYEAALTSGVMFSPFGTSRMRPTINYTFTGLQVGYMLGDVKRNGLCRGNFELAGEAFGSAIFQGEGSYISGGTVWLRYNLVPRRFPRLVPYAEAGAGMVSTDIDRGIVGQPFNFNLDLGLGVRYFVSRNLSLSLEYRYQHISNADLGPKNLGINAGGPILGVSYFF